MSSPSVGLTAGGRRCRGWSDAMTTMVCAERLMGLRVGRGEAACAGVEDGVTVGAAGAVGAARLAAALPLGGWEVDASTSGTTLAAGPTLACAAAGDAVGGPAARPLH